MRDLMQNQPEDSRSKWSRDGARFKSTPDSRYDWMRNRGQVTSQVAPVLDQIDGRIARVTADGAYDGGPTHRTIAARGDDIQVVIPPRSTAVPSDGPSPPTQRDRHLEMITKQGRLAWQVSEDYGRRSLVETAMGRYKTLIGSRLRARDFAAQRTGAAIGVTVLNRMLAAGCPDSVRRKVVIA